MSSARPPDADALADHAAFVRAVARAALRGDEAVDDVVQDTYVAALQSGPKNPRALRVWLAGVVRRQAAARIRKRGIRRRGDPHAARPEADGSTLDVAVRVETARHVVEAVLSLDEPYRSAILLRYWDDLPPREIARKKDVPVETVRTWVKRGLTRLRAKLEREQGTERGGWRAALLPLAAWPSAASPAAAVGGVLGGALVMKKTLWVVAALLIVGVGGWWWNRGGDAHDGEFAAGSPEAVREEPVEPGSSRPRLVGSPLPEEPEREGFAAADLPFRGRVVGPDGTPLSGARVEAFVWWCRTAGGQWHFHGSFRDHHQPTLLAATSGADGRFALPVTPDGSADDPEKPCVAVDVRTTVEGYVPAQTRLELDAEGEMRLHRGGTLAVKVIDRGGDPVPGARVGILASKGAGNALLRTLARETKGFSTGDDGRAETLLPAGRYRVRASAAGQAPRTVDDVDVEEGGRTEQVVTLGEGLLIEVRVIGPEDEAVAGAHVRLAGPARTSGQAMSDAQGRCKITTIAPPGESRRHWATVVAFHVEAKGYALRTGHQRLPRDETTFALELRLARGVPVRVRVVDDAGAPLEGARVSLGLNQNAALALPGSHVVTTDVDGWSELPRLSPATYDLYVSAGRLEAPFKLAVGTEAVEEELVLERRSAGLAGTVFLPDGSPAPGGRIGVVPADSDRPTVLAAGGTGIRRDGTFSLQNLKGGRHVLVATASGYLPQRQEVDIEPGETREGFVFRLEGRGRVHGRVLGWDDEPEPIVGAAVQLVVRVTEGGGTRVHLVPLAMTGADGRFEVQGLDGQGIELHITRHDWVPAWPWPKIVYASDEEARFVMKPASEGPGMPFEARVTREGVPYDGKVFVSVKEPGGEGFVGAGAPVSTGGGRYDGWIPIHPPGTYDLRFTARGCRPFDVLGVVLAHRSSRPTVDVALGLGAVLELRVVNGEGRPWADQWLRWRAGEIQTDANGIVKLTGMKPGALKHLHVQDQKDGRFTYAYFETVEVPGTLEVVLRRCGRVVVTTPLRHADLTHDVVFTILDAAGTVVDTQTARPAKALAWQEFASWALKVFDDGVHRVVVEAGALRAETEIDARVGREVKVELDPR